MKKKILDGNEACSLSSYLFTEAAGIYPITPSSPMAEHIDNWSNNGMTNIFDSKVNVVEMQSEAGAAGLVHGLLKGGVLTTTYTASQGLLLMLPNMYKMAGEMLPCVMHVAARSLSTHALSILGDHQDIYASRMTGFNMLCSSNVEEANHFSAIAHLSAIDSSLPFMHFFDGFRTSHEINKVNILEKDDVKDLINKEALEKFKNRAINPNNPKTYGTNQNDDIYFQATEVRNKYYDEIPNVVNSYMGKINTIANTDYKPFNYYGSDKAKKVIVAMGSVTETIKEVIDDLNEEIGLIIVRLYRPFSKEYFMNVLPDTVEKVAVLDRTKEFGAEGPLYLDVCSILKDTNIKVVGGRYGLSSKNTTPNQIKAVYDSLDNPKDNFTIGIKDDVTNLSLDVTDYKINKSNEMLIYGYGSDGMVSASKSLIKIIGNNSDKYVQCYNQYDSKKSGGVTKCHLRFSDNKIHSTYYVENPSLIAVTKDTYMNTFDILSDIKENGIFLLNTIKSEKEVIDYLNNNDKNIIKNKNIKFYIINAYELARKVGLGNKISTILESCIIYLSNIIDYDKAINDLKNEITKRFELKSMDIVKANIDAIDSFKEYIKEVKIEDTYESIERPKYIDIFEAIVHRKGDELPVSTFLDMPDGTFDAATSRKEKRCITDIVPKWINSNCIKCNMCSFVCPHGVIRPFKLSDEEFNNAPDFIKERCVDNYIIGISVKDCTGCGLCIKSCMAKDKALISDKFVDNVKEQEIFDYLVNNVTCKEENLNNVKNSQFKMPKIEFNGACAGCGQPAYIKLLTQLFGDSMVISNATGCSSIYGSSVPSMPYSIPWGTSLFEDNAEYGFGYLLADKFNKQKIVEIMKKYGDVFNEYIENINSYEITKKVYDSIDFDKYSELLPYKDYIVKRNIWTIGGDGWAYDIGFSGIDHVLASGENAKILVLDTQVYSNTGGQASKATPKGSVALFASSGKNTSKKDLARMMMCYPNVYVAQVSLAANPMQLIKTFKEANEYNGPAIIIAYAPCISHGIKGGMINSLDMEKEAVSCGYFPIFRRNPLTGFSLDCKPNFELYDEFLNKQTRYTVLSKINENSSELLLSNKDEAIERFKFYSSLEK
ncbi:MAG: pyruvate:ferredoxin (flavodoxin) oxidoreductase [Bacilli bacterium]|nr:pyruvate:ferredoxin (flavodoxin) oxidoreductase [Bacilli bacterium]